MTKEKNSGKAKRRRMPRRHVQARDWYIKERPIYEGLADTVRATLVSLLLEAGVPFVSVTARCKDVESFMKKIDSKGYVDPAVQNTDFAGIRVITYIASEAVQAGELISEAFNVDWSKSEDKRTRLGTDRFGYRSVHYVCDLGPVRSHLRENRRYTGRVFEIQVRTQLEHAWAEIQHDRGYKFGAKLPEDLERRLNLQAGVLEQVDREFNDIASALDAYKRQITRKTELRDLDVELNAASLTAYLTTRLKGVVRPEIHSIDELQSYESLLEETRAFGLRTLADVEELLTADFFAAEAKYHDNETYLGLLRNAMMYADLDRYFNSSFKKRWTAIDRPSILLLQSKYGNRRVTSYLGEYDMDVLDEEGNVIWSYDSDPYGE